jgi:hypothetical protein
VDRAAIFSAAGDSVWATSTNFTVKPEEMKEIVAAYKDPGKDGVKQVQSSGLHVAGERFVVLKADDRSIYGKKVSEQAFPFLLWALWDVRLRIGSGRWQWQAIRMSVLADRGRVRTMMKCGLKNT